MRKYEGRSREAAEYRKWYSWAAWRGPKGRRTQQLTAQPLCEFCLPRDIVRPATVADHVIPHRGDADLFWNGGLQSLCEPCHSIRKQQIETMGFSGATGADGWPIDPLHPANRPPNRPKPPNDPKPD